jgi:Flp pilus assembly protein TadD
MALALGADPEPAPVARPWLGRGLALALAAMTAVLLIPAWIADRDVARASANWTTDRQAAYDRLDRAQALAPLDVLPPTVEGVIAARSGDLRRAEAAFGEAAARDPQNWFPRFQLALLAGSRRDRAGAAARLREARARNPREPLVTEAIRQIRDGEPLTFAEVDDRLRRNR